MDASSAEEELVEELEELEEAQSAATLGSRMRKVLLLLALICGYTALGAVIYTGVELRKEKEDSRDARVEIGFLRAKYGITDGDWKAIRAVAGANTDCGACGGGDVSGICRGQDDCVWRFKFSAFFVATTISTIGYGTFSPQTALGKALVAVLGLPGLVLVGKYMGEVAGLVEDAVKAARARPHPVRGILQFSVFLSGPLTILLFALYAQRLTSWTFGNSAYFSFVTLSTIGYGDYVPDNPQFVHIGFVYIGLASIAATLGAITDLEWPATVRLEAMALTSRRRAKEGEAAVELRRAAAP